ncbi:MAG: tetratricopeptide repeat protein [Planctomycetaceae bacterium]
MCLLLCLLVSSGVCGSHSIEADEVDEADARIAAERFLTVLVKNPRFGTAFDRVYGFCIDRGSIATLKESLRAAANLPVEFAPAEGTITSDMVTLELPTTVDAGAACLLFGMIELRHSEADAASRVLRQAAELRPKDPVAHWYLAKALELGQKFDEAAVALEQAIASRPAKIDLLEIYKELARLHQRAQKPDAALAVWERLEKEFPGDLRVKEQIAATLTEDGRWEEALVRYQALVKETRNADQRVQSSLAASDVLIQLGRSQEAITVLETQLSDLDPDSWLYKEIRRRIEGTFRSRNDLPGLVTYYEQWLMTHADDVDAMARLARTLSLQNETANAADWYRKAIALAPSNESLRESLIGQLVRENKISDAIVQYEELSKFDSGNLDHLEDWGQLIVSQKDVPQEERQAKAAAVWNRMLENRADDSVTLARLAGLFRRADVRERAIKLYRQAIEKSPNEPQYRAYLGEYLHQLQRTDEAVSEWKQIADGDRRSKASLIRLAEVLNRFGQNELAVASMREACEMNPEPTERLQFAEMLRNRRAAGRQPSVSERDPTTVRTNETAVNTEGLRPPLAEDELLDEALQQLDLAEQSTEAADERQQILNERVKCLQVAGQLESQIKKISAELAAGTNVTADRWRILATCQDAAEKLNEATESAIKVVELEPDSIPGWSILADLYERTGRLGDAADAMKKLASLDRRGISEYLRKTARLQVRLGQFDDALATGREVIKATPGNPEAYQFFADLAFEVGQPKEAVESLRRAVRVNPGDEASLRALAKTLADEFQTPEAIELYWRAFEKAADLDSQTQIVVALSNLYLRSNQFPKLIERLELRSRELNLPTEMTRCIATAYREAGDFRKARETLESLLNHDDTDTDILKELVTVATQEHNLQQAFAYQEQVVKQSSARTEVDVLLRLAKDSGRSGDAKSLLQRDADALTSRKEILLKINELIPESPELATDLCERLLKIDPNDWEALVRRAEIAIAAKEIDIAKAYFRRVVDLRLDLSTPSAVYPDKYVIPDDVSADGKEYLRAMAVMKAVNDRQAGIYEVALIRSCNQLVGSEIENPAVEDLERVFGDTAVRRYGTPLARLLTEMVDSYSVSAQTRQALVSYLNRFPTQDVSPLITRAMLMQIDNKDLTQDQEAVARKWIIENLDSLLRSSPHLFWAESFNILIEKTLTESVARAIDDPAGRSELKAILIGYLRDASSLDQCGVLLVFAVALKDHELLADVLTQVKSLLKDSLSDDERKEFLSKFWQPIVLKCLHPSLQNRSISIGSKEQLEILDIVCLCQPRLENSSSGPAATWDWDYFLSSESRGIIKTILLELLRLDHQTEFDQWKQQQEQHASPESQALLIYMQSQFARLSGDRDALLFHQIRLAELQRSNHLLWLEIARECAAKGQLQVASELLARIKSNDTEVLHAVADAQLGIAIALGDAEQIRAVAKVLLGLPMAARDQQNLIALLSKQGLNEDVRSLEARMGRGAGTRQSVLARQLQTYTAQGNNELAAEVAWELLKLASGGTLFSGQRPNDDRDDGGERLQAIKALGKLGRLQPLIDRYEAMLEASPESLDLLEILCEFHEAAEQFPQLSEKRDRIALLSQKAPPSLKAKAVALENSGDVSGACDIYLQILKDDPQAFAEDMETYVQAFERAKRHADFLSAVLSIDEKYWNEHASLIVNMIADLARAKTNDEVVQKSIDAMLSSEETRRFAIGGFLARPEVIAEERLLPAIQVELTREEAFSDISRINQSFLILQAVKNESSLKTLHEFLLSRRAAEHQDSVSYAELPLLYVAARLGLREQVGQQVATITSCKAEVASLQPDEILTLNTRLKELSKDWDRVRTQLLECLVSLEIEDAETEDTVLDELGAAWASLGELQKARGILNQRVQKMLVNTGAATGNASESIRQLLQAGEKIQHSGFPIEGARLLLNVTPHDIDEFTSDLDDDKAIAFKSRFNASQRWARQQISAEKLVAWYAMAVDDVVAAAADPTSNQTDADQAVDLLLELSGTTDPRCRDAEELRGLRLDSVLLSVISKSTFESEELRQRIKAATEILLAQSAADVRMLTVALALAIQATDEETIKQVCKRSLEVAGTAEYPGVVPEKAANLVGRPNRIPEILRSEADLSCVLMAGLVASRKEQKSLVDRLLQRSIVAANGSANRLIKVAVSQECVAVSKRAGLADLVAQCEQRSAAAVDEQIKATSMGIKGEIDLAHEIRTRLLGK